MDESFDHRWAELAVSQLRAAGVAFAPGLTDRDFDAIGSAFGASVPFELEQFLRAGCPVSPRWARWGDGADAVAADARAWVDRAFEFDIIGHQYWHESFGERPQDDARAVARALSVVHAAPPLIPIYAHRYLVAFQGVGPRPVLSVWQAVDSIFYGNDLADYLAREVDVDRPTWATADPPRVPVWEDLFDLFGEGGDL